MIEMRLLDLQVEYTNHAVNESDVRSLGLESGRAREDIAREYGHVLREFLNAQSAAKNFGRKGLEMHVEGTIVDTLKTRSATGLTIHGTLARRASAERLVCFMPAAQTGTGTRNPKLFSRWNWQTQMPKQHVLALADPALGLDDEIRGAWYLHPSSDLMEDMASMVREQVERLGLTNEQVLFYGSSLGGFGGLGMASLLPGSSAIAEIPQIDIAQWTSPGSIKAMETRILGKTFAEHRVTYPEMVDVRDRFRKSAFVPPFLLVSNEKDLSFNVQQDFMADVAGSELPKAGQQRLLLTSHVTGHAALAKADALALIDRWSVSADLAGLEFMDFETAA